MTKKEKMRDLICAGLNELIKQKKIDLNGGTDVSGEHLCELFGKPTRISWDGIGHGEIRISVWWGIKPQCKNSETTQPLNKHLVDALDTCCSAWLERKKGKWLQGTGGDYIYDTYCSREALPALKKIPVVKCIEYEKEGPFFS